MIVEPAPAKLNLALHVRARRPDGYHGLETLFAFCGDGDTIALEAAEVERLTITGPFAAGLEGHDNLVTRAARAFVNRFAPGRHHAITLDKRLPIASGIGGGSADAAATLRALARLYDVNIESPALFALADALGSDVPACLYGRPCFASGRGEALRFVKPLSPLPVLLVNPGVPVSTGAVFARWDGVDRGALRAGDPWRSALAGRNDLEGPARHVAPVIGDVLAALGETAPLLARMSGSGATCFAIYPDEPSRDRADQTLAEAWPEWWRLPTWLQGAAAD